MELNNIIIEMDDVKSEFDDKGKYIFTLRPVHDVLAPSENITRDAI